MTRTRHLRFRKPLLYPAELRDQLRNFVSGYFLGTTFRSLNILLYSIPSQIWKPADCLPWAFFPPPRLGADSVRGSMLGPGFGACCGVTRDGRSSAAAAFEHLGAYMVATTETVRAAKKQ